MQDLQLIIFDVCYTVPNARSLRNKVLDLQALFFFFLNNLFFNLNITLYNITYITYLMTVIDKNCFT